MTRVLLIVSSLAIGASALAQVDTAKVDTTPAPTRLWTINPIALVDPYGPSSLRVGFEKLVSPHISLALEACGYFQYIGTANATEQLQGAGGRVSVIHWQKRSAGYARGISLDLGYKNTAGTASDSIMIDGVAPYRHTYHIDRKVITVRLCMVAQRHWTKRYWTELYYGVGIRFEHSTSSGITQEELDARDLWGHDNDNFLVPAIHGVGDFIQPDLVIGLRIGLAGR